MISPGQTAGEHVFAPEHDGTAEDDGWLLSVVSDRATRPAAGGAACKAPVLVLTSDLKMWVGAKKLL